MSLEEFRDIMLSANIYDLVLRDDFQAMDDLFYSGLEFIKEYMGPDPEKDYLPPDIYKKFLQDDFQNAKDLYSWTMATSAIVQRRASPLHIRKMEVRDVVVQEGLLITQSSTLNENEKNIVAFSRWFAINVNRHGSFKIIWEDDKRGKYIPSFSSDGIIKSIDRRFYQQFLKKNPWNLFIPYKKRKEAKKDLVAVERKLSRKRISPHYKVCPICKEEYIGLRSDKTTCGKDKCRKAYSQEHGPVRKKREINLHFKVCPICKEEYSSSRSDKTTCGKDKCRKAYYRKHGVVRKKREVKGSSLPEPSALP